jgi:hypothetical protein
LPERFTGVADQRKVRQLAFAKCRKHFSYNNDISSGPGQIGFRWLSTRSSRPSPRLLTLLFNFRTVLICRHPPRPAPLQSPARIPVGQHIPRQRPGYRRLNPKIHLRFGSVSQMLRALLRMKTPSRARRRRESENRRMMILTGRTLLLRRARNPSASSESILFVIISASKADGVDRLRTVYTYPARYSSPPASM